METAARSGEPAWLVVRSVPRHGFRVCGAGAKALRVRNGVTTGSASVVPAQWVQRRDTIRAGRILFEGCDD
jgi:hypothetical protein